MEEIDNKKKFSFWIPCFKNHQKTLIEYSSHLSSFILNHKERKYAISSISEESQISFNYDNEYSLNCKLLPESNDIVFKNKFYMTIVHYSIMSNFNIPSIFIMCGDADNYILSES